MLRRFATPVAVALALSGTSVFVSAQKSAPEARDTTLAPITRGSGPYLLKFYPTNTGRIAQFESPAGYSHVYFGDYCLCVGSASTATYQGYNFVPFSIAQPNGPGTLPLTVTAKTADNLWQAKWTYTTSPTNLSQSGDVELNAKVTLKHLAGGAAFVYLALGYDLDVDGTTTNYGDQSLAWQDSSGSSTWQRGTIHAVDILGQTRQNYNWASVNTLASGSYANCGYNPTNTVSGDLYSQVVYQLGTMGTGAQKTVTFQWSRN